MVLRQPESQFQIIEVLWITALENANSQAGEIVLGTMIQYFQNLTKRVSKSRCLRVFKGELYLQTPLLNLLL